MTTALMERRRQKSNPKKLRRTTALMERRRQKPNPQKPRRQDTAALLRSLGMSCTLNRLLLIDEREVPALNGDEKDVPKDSILRPRNQQLTCCLRVPQKFFIPKSTVRSWERLMRE
mmetsp:Transcript_35873/g.53453  ORF Transcript_35873/g.53453 Transcript_35873/m.53453 type:complete len:116 (-) Transcript_35873:926-1273(-)